MSLRVYLILGTCLFAVINEASATSDGELKRLTSNFEAAKTQTEMNLTSRELAEFWDNRLSAIEGKIEARMDGRERKQFAESKKRWRSYRSSEVAFQTSFFDGGSIQQLIANSAYSQITEHRVGEMESLFKEAFDGKAKPNGSANGGQPRRSETNPAPSAGGPRRGPLR